MNTVHFVRHGENPANLNREFSHRVVDYPLTPRGVAQAEATARLIVGAPISAVFTSPLVRARQTAEIIAAPLGLPVVVVEAFREVNVGALELRPPTPEDWALHDDIFARWLAGEAALRFPEGESHADLCERMRVGLVETLRDRDEEELVIVAHGGILAATIWAFCDNITPAEMTLIPNCSVTRLRMEAQDGDVRGTVEAWAECAHLSEEHARDPLAAPAPPRREG